MSMRLLTDLVGKLKDGKHSAFVVSSEFMTDTHQYAVRVQSRDAHPLFGAIGNTIEEAASKVETLIRLGERLVDRTTGKKWIWDSAIGGFQQLI